MKLPVCLFGVLSGLMLLGLVSCGTDADFENRFAADAGDILYSDVSAAETVPEPETEPFIPAQKTIPTDAEPVPDADFPDAEPDDVIVLPVVEPEPETVPPVAEPEPETVPPVAEPEPETVPPVAEPEPETVPPVAEPEPETVPAAEAKPQTAPAAEAKPQTAPAAEAKPKTAVTVPNTIPAGVTFVCNTSSGKYHLPDCGSVAKIKAENIAYMTCAEPDLPSGYAPCSVCLAASAALQKAQIPAADAGTVSYILNTNTMKFHSPLCKSVKKIKAENYAEFTGTRDEAIASGYDPCGNCKP